MINPSPAGAARRFGARPALCGRRWRVIIWVLVRLTQLQAGLLGRLGSTSEDVAKVITQAVTARRPRARYLINPVAKSLVAMNRVLPARAYDSMLRRQYGLPR